MNTELIMAEYADTILEEDDLEVENLNIMDNVVDKDCVGDQCDLEIDNLVDKYSKLDINSKYLDSFNITLDENKDVTNYIDLLQNYNVIFEENKVLKKELLEKKGEIQMLKEEVDQQRNKRKEETQQLKDEVVQQKNKLKLLKNRDKSERDDEDERRKKDENQAKIIAQNRKQIKRQRRDHNMLKNELNQMKELFILSKEEKKIEGDTGSSLCKCNHGQDALDLLTLDTNLNTCDENLVENGDEILPVSTPISPNLPAISPIAPTLAPTTPYLPIITPMTPKILPIQNNNTNKPLTIVPGLKTYSNCLKTNTLIVSDSMVGRLTARQIRKEIGTESENVILNKHPGATAEEIQHYSAIQLKVHKPEKMIIVAGANDILRDRKNGNLNETIISNNIINIGLQARNSGTQKIYISGLLTMTGTYMRNVIHRINLLLQDRCIKEGFIFIDNTDITVAHLSKDGLHPNFYGSIILKMNVLKCFPNFNPYLCDFLGTYEDALY